MYVERKTKDAPLQKKASDVQGDVSISSDDILEPLSGESVSDFSISQGEDSSPMCQAQVPMQFKSAPVNSGASIDTERIIQRKENNTGLPDTLKSGIENISGYSMDDVKVHYNSSRPALLQAHAYAQGSEIHLAPGQERHLPHEAWHVVQQKQGRVKPSLQMKGNVKVNDDDALEREADIMGADALALGGGLKNKSQQKVNTRLMGNQCFIDNVSPRLQRKSRSSIPAVNAAPSTAQQPVIQAKAVNKQGNVLSIADLLAEFSKPEYLGGNYRIKFLLAIGRSATHVSKAIDAEKIKTSLINHKKRGPNHKEVKNSAKALTEFRKERERLEKLLVRSKFPKKTIYNPLKRALDEGNPMFFTIEDIKKFLDGEHVPGISDLGADDIMGQNDEVLPYKPQEGEQPLEQWSHTEFEQLDADQKPLERARTIAASLERMKEKRENYEARSDGIDQDGNLPNAADEEMKLIAETFRKTTFFYGTTGEISTNKTKFKNLFAKVKNVKAKRLGDKVGSYSAGTRNMGFIKAMAGDETDAQMMDMYYGGQELEAWHMMANPIIGKYVHDMMGYAGEYNHAESMDTTFRKNFPLGGDSENWENRGWSGNAKPEFGTKAGQPDRQENAALRADAPLEWLPEKSATMEISRVIREAVRKFGGTIVFEGSEVHNQGHFVPGAYKGDTNVEAEALLPLFLAAPQSSSVTFGAGRLVFHWLGSPAIPTRSLFLKNWAFPKQQGREVIHHGRMGVIFFNPKRNQRGLTGEIDRKTDRPVDWYWRFPKGDDAQPLEDMDYLDVAAGRRQDGDVVEY